MTSSERIDCNPGVTRRLKSPPKPGQKSVFLAERFPSIPDGCEELPLAAPWFRLAELLRRSGCWVHDPISRDAARIAKPPSPTGKVCLYHGVATRLVERVKSDAEQKLAMSVLRSGFSRRFGSACSRRTTSTTRPASERSMRSWVA